MSFYRNTEGYFDPTAGEALSNIRKKERSDRRKAIRRQKAAKPRCEVWRCDEVSGKDRRNEDGSVAEPR